MSLGDMWAAEVRTVVARDGTVKAEGQLYWCLEMQRLVGREVFVRVPVREGAAAQVWIGEHYQCSPEVIADIGFVLPSYAGKMMSEARVAGEARAASIVRLQADLLLQLLDDLHEDRRAGVVAIIFRKATCQFKLLKKRFTYGWLSSDESGADGDLERAERIKSRLRLAQRIFEVGKFGIVDHFESPAADGGNASGAEPNAHRLCGDAK